MHTMFVHVFLCGMSTQLCREAFSYPVVEQNPRAIIDPCLIVKKSWRSLPACEGEDVSKGHSPLTGCPPGETKHFSLVTIIAAKTLTLLPSILGNTLIWWKIPGCLLTIPLVCLFRKQSNYVFECFATTEAEDAFHCFSRFIFVASE